jgi:hypothetical protein
MNTNVGMIDRVIRLVLAAALLYLGLGFYGIGTGLGIGLTGVGAVLALTGVFGFCGLYKVLGVDTSRSSQSPQA